MKRICFFSRVVFRKVLSDGRFHLKWETPGLSLHSSSVYRDATAEEGSQITDLEEWIWIGVRAKDLAGKPANEVADCLQLAYEELEKGSSA